MTRAFLSRIASRDQAKQREAAAGACLSCRDLEIENTRLERENETLKRDLEKAKQRILLLRGEGKKKKSEAHKPSSTHEHRPNSDDKNRSNKGGAQPGHSGKSRPKADPNLADEVIHLTPPETCPDCGGSGSFKVSLSYFRRLIDIPSKIAREFCYRIPYCECRQCGHKFRFQLGALPRMLLGNKLIAKAATMHFLDGISLSQVISTLNLNVSEGVLHNSFRVLTEHLEPAYESLHEDYRSDKVRHADETGWRTDGKSGYAWLFSSLRTSIFVFGVSRASITPKKILGKKPLAGCLVVDRYCGYNQLPVSLQYCFAHLKRELDGFIEDIDYPSSLPMAKELSELFSRAMKLKESKISDKEYYKKSAEISDRMLELANFDQPDLGVRKIQSILLDHADRMFLWVKDRDIPAHNNFAERGIRPIVLARKRCFGSQSEQGAWRRTCITSVLATAKKRLKDQTCEQWLADTLDQIAVDPTKTVTQLMPK